jgi:hypothetical protein
MIRALTQAYISAIIGSGSAQAPVAERPVALPPQKSAPDVPSSSDCRAHAHACLESVKTAAKN